MFYWWERGEYYGRKFELLPLILVRGGGEYDHHSLACHTPPIPPLIVHSSIGNSMIILNGETRREKKGGGTFACTTIFNLKLNIDTGLGMSLS